MKKESEPTNQQILEAINAFSEQTERRFIKLELDVTELKTDVAVLKTDVAVLKTDVTNLKNDMTGVKARMVTKDYLDDKLADLRGEIIVMFDKRQPEMKYL